MALGHELFSSTPLNTHRLGPLARWPRRAEEAKRRSTTVHGQPAAPQNCRAAVPAPARG